MAAKPKVLKTPLQDAAHALPPVWPAIATAIKAVHAGEADPRQQQMAMDWIVRYAAGKDSFHYYPSERDTAFSLGRSFVGEQIVGLINTDVGLLKQEE